MLRPSLSSEENVLEHVRRDLMPSLASVHIRVGVSTIFGGLLSLLVCGQFGIGWTDWATSFSHKVHETMDPFSCALVCGSLFAIFPSLVMRISCSPMLFKTVISKYKLVVTSWFAGFGGLLAWQGHHGNSLLQFSAWIFAALLGLKIWTMALQRIVPVLDLKVSSRPL